MSVIETEIMNWFPKWFEGRKASISKALVRGYCRFCRFGEIEDFISEHGHLKGRLLLGQALDFLNIRYYVDHVERTYIPETGRCIIVANHPAGIVDALALLHFVSQIRPDVKILANEALGALGLLEDMIIPVDVFGTAGRRSSLEALKQALYEDRCVIIFPAGEVSRLRPTGIKDTPWRGSFVRLAEEFKAPVVPVRIKARNSALFYSFSAVYKPLGTLLLPREITSRRNTRIGLRIGKPQRVDSGPSAKPSLKAIRQSLYAIGTRRASRSVGHEPVIAPVDVRLVIAALKKLVEVGATPDGKIIYSGRIAPDSPLLLEIGRLREISFRAVGEGTGRRLDIDKYDTWYEHIVLWNPEELEVVGAYRLAIGEAVYRDHGVEGFYSASLFDYSCEFLPKMVHGAELGRSFVVPKYWNSRSLDNLWHGIGALLSQYPEIRYLFGPVSISAELPIAARERLIAHYGQFYSDDGRAVKAKRPFRFLSSLAGGPDRDQDFKAMKLDLQAMGVKVPTLYKQYTDLCEPEGVRFMAFGIDPVFSNAIDGLICLDIERMKPAKYRRYFDTAQMGQPATV